MTVSDDDLRALAESACARENGRDWDSMFSGDQEAQISAWISGYRAAEVSMSDEVAATGDYPGM